MANYDSAWIINEAVRVRTDGVGIGAGFVVESMPDASGGYRSARLSTWDGKLLINNCFVDVGDDLMAYLSVMDEAGEAEPGSWVRSEPYEDDEPGHDCPKDAFLEDPITQAYGVGGEMVGLIPCVVCEARGTQ